MRQGERQETVTLFFSLSLSENVLAKKRKPCSLSLSLSFLPFARCEGKRVAEVWGEGVKEGLNFLEDNFRKEEGKVVVVVAEYMTAASAASVTPPLYSLTLGGRGGGGEEERNSISLEFLGLPAANISLLLSFLEEEQFFFLRALEEGAFLLAMGRPSSQYSWALFLCAGNLHTITQHIFYAKLFRIIRFLMTAPDKETCYRLISNLVLFSDSLAKFCSRNLISGFVLIADCMPTHLFAILQATTALMSRGFYPHIDVQWYINIC